MTVPRRVVTSTCEFVVFQASDELRQIIEEVIELTPESVGATDAVLADLIHDKREARIREITQGLRSSLLGVIGRAIDSGELYRPMSGSRDLESFVLMESAPTEKLPRFAVSLDVGIEDKPGRSDKLGGYARLILMIGLAPSAEPRQAGSEVSVEFVAVENGTGKIIKKFLCQRPPNGSWAAFDTRYSGFDLPPNSRLCILVSYQTLTEMD